MAVAAFGNGALAPGAAAGVFAGDETEVTHEFARVVEAAQVAEFGHDDHAADGLEDRERRSRDPAQLSDDDAGKIEGVQVVVYDADGNIPDTLQVNYFVESFPAREQTATSADGLWVASNVPPGDLRVEMWGQVGGELVLLGATELKSEADSINIANIFAGYGDGVKYPASCAAP